MGILAKLAGVFAKVKGAVLATTATKVATAAVTVVVLGSGTVALATSGVFTSAKKELEKAYKETQEAAAPMTYEELFGLNALRNAIKEQGSEFGLDVTVTELDMSSLGLNGMKLPNVGVTLQGRTNKEQETAMELGLSMAGTTLLTGKLYANQEQLQVAVPKLFSPVLALNYRSKNFQEDMLNSYLVELADIDTEELKRIMEKLPKEGKVTDFLEEHGEKVLELAKAVGTLLNGTKYDRKGKQELVLPEANMQCKVYTGIVEEEALDKFLAVVIPMIEDSVKEFYSGLGGEAALFGTYEEFEKNYLAFYREIQKVNMTTYVYEKRIAKQELTFTIREEEGKLDVWYALEGNPYETMELVMTLPMPEREPLQFSYAVATSNTEDTYEVTLDETIDGISVEASFRYEKLDGEFELCCKAEEVTMTVQGAVGELEKGKKISLELDSLAIGDIDNAETINLNTELYLQVLEKDVASLDGEVKDVLKMTEEDFDALGKEITTNVYQMIFSLLGFGSF